MLSSITILKILLILHLFLSLASCQGGGRDQIWNPVHLAILAQNQKDIKNQAASQLKDLAAAQLSRKKSMPSLQRTDAEGGDLTANTIIISKERWRVFEEALQIEDPEGKAGPSPVYILREAARSLTKLVIQIEFVAKQMSRITKLPRNKKRKDKMHAKFTAIFDKLMGAIQPIFTYHIPQNGKEDKEVPGIIGRGSYIDPTWGNAAIFLKAQLRNLLAYDEVAQNTILVSDSLLLTAFQELNDILLNAIPYLSEMQAVVAEIGKEDPDNYFAINIEYPKSSPEGFRRQDVGYFDYYQRRYTEEYAARQIDAITATGVPVGEPFKSWPEADKITIEMYDVVLVLFNRIVLGNLTLMMEMMIDVLFASNIFLGRRSLYPDYKFGLQLKLRMEELPKNWDAFSWMESYPEIAIDGSEARDSLFKPGPADFLLPIKGLT
ncbi:hypothetical protein TWF506_007309 [Arthrobotrys conoides]|uniref:MAT1-1-2 n=1 Tax=Arthrobotrys conoides TaxID=74498 RepID=A0AAN8NK13_9PEZI